MWTDENHEVRQNWDTSCILHQTEALWATTNRNCEQQRKHDKSISCKRYNSSLEKKKNPPKWPFNCFGETFYWCDEKWKKAYTINRAAIAIEPVSQKRIENVWLSRCEFFTYIFATWHISCRIYRAFSKINVQIASTLVLFLLINRNENAPKL